MAASQKSSKPHSASFLQAITDSLNHDYGIKAILHEWEAEEWDEILVQISDYTALGVTVEDGTTLNLYKFAFAGEEDMLSFVQSHGFDRTTYWESRYDLANPNDFARVLHLIRTNVDENKCWPHTTRR
jgi:hypothetical protein